jgi:hypothetical protein
MTVAGEPEPAPPTVAAPRTNLFTTGLLLLLVLTISLCLLIGAHLWFPPTNVAPAWDLPL